MSTSPISFNPTKALPLLTLLENVVNDIELVDWEDISSDDEVSSLVEIEQNKLQFPHGIYPPPLESANLERKSQKTKSNKYQDQSADDASDSDASDNDSSGSDTSQNDLTESKTDIHQFTVSDSDSDVDDSDVGKTREEIYNQISNIPSMLPNSKISSRIARLEDEITTDKPWHMKGEVRGSDRPQDSLLGVEVDFDHAPKLTSRDEEEIRTSLLDLIKERIVTKTFDNPEKFKAVSTSEEVEEEGEKSDTGKFDAATFEKSSKSLTEMALDELDRQKRGQLDGDLPPEKVAILEKMDDLFSCLDLLVRV